MTSRTPPGSSRAKTRSRLPGSSSALVPAILLCACLAAVSPREGKPVEVGAGKALVFGRIRVTSPGYSRELLVFSRDPMEHVMPPDPMLNLELRGVRPPGGAVKYTTAPSPAIGGDGSFHWVLAEGDYALASNPRPYGSTRFDPAETTVLARFTVPRGAGTVYLGTLEIVVDFQQSDLVEAWKGNETPYSVVQLSVADESGMAFTALLARYPSVPEPRTTVPMVPEPP